MSKKAKLLLSLCYPLGMLAMLARNFFKDELSDFNVGFLDGITVVFTLTWIIYCGYCLGKRQNPFRI